MTYRIPSLIVLAGGALLMTATTANATPPVALHTLPGMTRIGMPAPINIGGMPGSNPNTWSPYPINRGGMPGSDPRTWSPYPINGVMPGSDPRTWSPYPLNRYSWDYDNGPIPYWLQNPYWRQSMPAQTLAPVVRYPSVNTNNVVLPYINPYAGYGPFLNPYAGALINPYGGVNLPLTGYNLYD